MITYTTIDKDTIQKTETIDLKPLKARLAQIDVELVNVGKMPEIVSVKNAEKEEIFNRLSGEKQDLLNQLTKYGDNV